MGATKSSARPKAAASNQSAIKPDAFVRQAEESPPGLVWELFDFLKFNKAWWLTPIVVALLLVSALVVASASGALPFLYAGF